jgi:hypothetical protein
MLAFPLMEGCALESITPSSSEEAFRTYAAKSGWRDGAVSASLLTATVIGFYKDVPISGLTQENGDELLFQWGIYEWGHGPTFEFDITRQFIKSATDGDAAISQLRVTAHYRPTAALAAVTSGNAWCKSKLEADAFEQFIRGSNSFAAVQAIEPLKVAVAWGPV